MLFEVGAIAACIAAYGLLFFRPKTGSVLPTLTKFSHLAFLLV
jgi:hypothetical protein